jgi:hypothetical protein
MKNSLHTNPILFKMVVLITCFMLAMLYNKSKAANIKYQPHNASHQAVNTN